MDVKEVIASQYLATLGMMKQIVGKCPDEVWRNPQPTGQSPARQ